MGLLRLLSFRRKDPTVDGRMHRPLRGLQRLPWRVQALRDLRVQALLLLGDLRRLGDLDFLGDLRRIGDLDFLGDLRRIGDLLLREAFTEGDALFLY